MHQPSLKTVSVFRRHYGRRYTELPVDGIDQTAFFISCADTFMRPEHYDLRPGDIVRWRQEEGYVEAVISNVTREPKAVRVALHECHALPADFFPY
ncbi:MAG: hypothetical protein EI684_19750 [Candidatus Viridilinea halotolerans]|uniref:Uncharacterized protein n=1 Tax=Candidatus Viridilinea halotolerans TaxID=2491704 RepID=A0A426TSI3_9CHLR|nr:MAG: hypothetical protein EI684_19750 [Candidatus Viridilinea halotolerans]